MEKEISRSQGRGNRYERDIFEAQPHSSTLFESAYAILTEDCPALDDLAVQALNRAYMAGKLINDPTVPQSQRQAYRAITDATSARLIDRARVYESRLRSMSIPESSPQRRPVNLKRAAVSR